MTVTTLDHIHYEYELIESLSNIHAHLNPRASFIMLGYAIDCSKDRKKFGMEKNSYHSFRLLSEWLNLLNKSRFPTAQEFFCKVVEHLN